MPRVRIRLAIGDLRIEYAGSLAFHDRVIAPLLTSLGAAEGTGPARPPAGEAQGEVPGLEPGETIPAPARLWTPAAPERFAQFTAQVGARAETVDQRIMAFAFYVWNYEKRERWNIAEVVAFFRTLHQDPPDELDERLAVLTSSKRFLEHDGDGAWKLSTKGVNYVKNRLLAGDV